jgi:hypothetical protein
MEPRALPPLAEDPERLAAALDDCRGELAVARTQVVDAAELLQEERRRHEEERRRHANTRSEVDAFAKALTAFFDFQRRSWSGPSSGWRRPLVRPGLAPVNRDEVDLMDAVAASLLFDAAWYLRTNADVLASGIDPALHFVRFGAFEGRAPGPAVDVHSFLADHPEAREGALEPWLRLLAGDE